jgi:hypothetical protein
MPYRQLSLFDDTITCPRCGARFSPQRAPRAFSPVAQAILVKVPERFRDGQQLPVATVARLTGYSVAQAHRGLLELALARRGVVRLRRGDRKHVYHYAPDSTLQHATVST